MQRSGLVRLTEANRFRTSDGLTGMIMQGELGELEWLRGEEAQVLFREDAVTILGGPVRQQRLVLNKDKFEVIPVAGPAAAPFVDDWISTRLLCLQCNSLWSPSSRGANVCPNDSAKLVDIGPAQEDNILGAGTLVSVDGESYIPERPFSRGYSSDLYTVRHAKHGQCIAKVLNKKFSQDLKWVAPFREEGIRLSSLTHRNLVRALDFGVAEKRPFIIFEFLEGKTLAQILWHHGSMCLYDALFMALDVAETLLFLTNVGIHYEDLNPREIVLLANSQIKLIDLGRRSPVGPLSETLSSGGSFGGDAGYTSPEILQGNPSTDASTVYSLGCVLFEALAGKNPFKAGNLIVTGRRQLDSVRPEITSLREGRVCPPKVRDFIRQMLAIDPPVRPTMYEVRERLTQLSR